MTESPLKNILGMYLVLVIGLPCLPFLGISVHTSCTFSMTIFICRSNAFTLPNSFLLFLKAISTSLFAFTDLVNSENGPTLKVYSWGLFFYSSILITSYKYLIISTFTINNNGPRARLAGLSRRITRTQFSFHSSRRIQS